MSHSPDPIDYDKLLDNTLRFILEAEDAFYSPTLNIRIKTFDLSTRDRCRDAISPSHWETLTELQRARWITKASGWWLTTQTATGTFTVHAVESPEKLEEAFQEFRRVFRSFTT